jgi:hypothetical protein
MYLGVMYLSEICNMSGSKLQTGIENNKHDKNIYNVTLQRPKQKKPNSYSSKFWKKATQSFEQNGKKLNSTLGPWTIYHSSSGRWNAYRSKNNKVYQFINKQNEAGLWDVYTSHGSQLRFVEAVPLYRFNITDGTPIQVKSLANGSIYGDMTAIVSTDTTTTTTTFYGPDVSWDNFIKSQPHWVESLLQDVHFFSGKLFTN